VKTTYPNQLDYTELLGKRERKEKERERERKKERETERKRERREMRSQSSDVRHCVRVVKELVLKANGLCPREFKSRRCRFFGGGKKKVPCAGIEPATNRLKVERSTELS
jgi:hypothetical protein